MAYCNKCGAYIPDGLSACLACGYDENLANQENTAAKTQSANDVIRERLEKQRRARQEENRRWAEQEEQRRRQQEEERQRAEQEQEQQRRAKQEQSRQWAEEEYARRQAERENAARNYTYRSTLSQTGAGQSGQSSKLFAALSYLSFLFALPYVLTPNDEFAKFHAKQGLKLFIFTIISDMIGALTGVGWILSLLRFYFIYKGMSNAIQGKQEVLPWIGDIGG